MHLYILIYSNSRKNTQSQVLILPSLTIPNPSSSSLHICFSLIVLSSLLHGPRNQPRWGGLPHHRRASDPIRWGHRWRHPSPTIQSHLRIQRWPLQETSVLNPRGRPNLPNLDLANRWETHHQKRQRNGNFKKKTHLGV